MRWWLRSYNNISTFLKLFSRQSLSLCLGHSPQLLCPHAHRGTVCLSHVGTCPVWWFWEGREVKNILNSLIVCWDLENQSIVVAQDCWEKCLLGQDKICLDMSMVLKRLCIWMLGGMTSWRVLASVLNMYHLPFPALLFLLLRVGSLAETHYALEYCPKKYLGACVPFLDEDSQKHSWWWEHLKPYSYF